MPIIQHDCRTLTSLTLAHKGKKTLIESKLLIRKDLNKHERLSNITLTQIKVKEHHLYNH